MLSVNLVASSYKPYGHKPPESTSEGLKPARGAYPKEHCASHDQLLALCGVQHLLIMADYLMPEVQQPIIVMILIICSPYFYALVMSNITCNHKGAKVIRYICIIHTVTCINKLVGMTPVIVRWFHF